MSSLSEQDHLNPNDPTYYAPRWLRERSEPRSVASQEPRSEPVRSMVSPPVSRDTKLEKAVSGALWHPLDPEVIHEPAELARELDRRAAVTTVVGRVVAAIGVAAVVALFFVIMVPGSRSPDTASTSGSTSGANLQSTSAQSKDTPQSGPREGGSKSALAEFQTLLSSAQANQPATHEQSEQLLQQFLKWGQKPGAANATQ